MIFVYNFLQVALLIITFPLILIIVLSKEKYRSRMGNRLGIGLKQKTALLNQETNKTIWIHCLSVGEVTSALPLVQGIREEMDPVSIVFSASTTTGMKIAQEKIKPHVDCVVDAPLDLFFVIKKYLRLIQPDLFILVETDFWPNWLYILRQNGIPLLLVNGRISQTSFSKYRRFHLFFNSMFNSFALLSMQTENDAAQMRQLGVPGERIKTLGNLKYDTKLYSTSDNKEKPGATDPRIPEDALIWVCGSTHPGEEKVIITALTGLLQSRKDIVLILAPRDPGRSDEIYKLITDQGLHSMRRTCPADPPAPILILDTIGELAACYKLARVAFIGGSLVDCGGHNPLEASAYGVPVLFGPHMDDFLEISEDLTGCGGGLTVDSATELEHSVRQVLEDGTVHQRMSNAGRELVDRNSGVIDHHIQEIRSLLSDASVRT